jgi:tetratricopeptide (TPR) repeat protein
MYVRTFIILAMVVVVSNVQGDANLRGIVLANELGGPPMANVEVSAVAGNPNNTGADGKFGFTFPGRSPGDTVRLSFRKEGYVVVNDIQLELMLPTHPEERPAIFLLCKEGDREEMARRFYRLKSIEAIDETYTKKFEEAQNASAAELAKLRQERDQAKEAAEKVAEGLAKQKPGSGSELYQTAMRLFLDGKVDQALVTLNDEKLRELSRAAKQRRAQAETATEEAIQNWLLKAQLLTVQFHFDDAEKAYQGAIDTAPDSFNANLAFARFNYDLNRYEKAMRAFARCLELAKLRGNNGDVARTLNGLAALDAVQNRPEAARKGYEEALKIRRELAQKNPDTYLPDVAQTVSNLAVLDTNQNRQEAARKEYEEALKIRRELAQKDPDTYLPVVARTLSNLAGLDQNQNRMEAARKGYEEALKIYSELAQKNSDTYLPEVARTLSNLAGVDQNENQVEAARKGYEEALKIRRDFAQKNPDTYLPGVAETLNNLAALNQKQNRMEAARREYEEALKIRRELARKDPDTYLPGVAQTLNNLALLDRRQNRMEVARKGFEEALKIRRELANANPDTYLPYVAATLNNLALLDRDQNHPEAARIEFEEALGIYQRFAQRNPERFQSDVARIKDSLQRLR